MGDKDERPLLQRRGGRRISIPSSPISPTLPKRSDRFLRPSEALNMTDNSSAVETTSDHPVIDLTFPSPILDDPDVGFGVGRDGSSKTKSIHTVITDDRDRRRSIEQPVGPPISTRTPDGRQSQNLRPTYLSDMTSRSSPILGRTLEVRDKFTETPGSAGRNYSTTSLSTERSISDENVNTKANVTKKSRLNLLNPMSLLARRRSSHNTKIEEMNVNTSPHVPAIPDNFDPSIRGNIVHDFSTPRSKRSHFDNSPRREAFSSPISLRRPSDFGTPGNNYGSSPSPALHSPMFREHFQDDEHSLQPGQTAYLHNVASTRKMFDAPSPSTLPSFAQKLPSIIPEPQKLTDDKNVPVISIPHPEDSPPPPPPPPKRTPSPHLDLPPAAALPRHMTSVSSRFSFQIAGHASSAQEKLLEERHKEHFAKEGSKVDTTEKNAEDDYEEYEFDDDDDFEERIPGVNTDFDDEDGFNTDDIPIRNIDVQSSQKPPEDYRKSLHDFHFTPNITTFTPTSPNHPSQPTPIDTEGFPIGVADTKYSPINFAGGYAKRKQTDDTVTPLFFEGLRISTINHSEVPHQETTPPPEQAHANFDDVELYFDDGEFDIGDADTGYQFDESILDDSEQIRDVPAENAKRYEAALERSAPGDQITAVDPNTIAISRDTSCSSNFVGVRGGDSSDYPASREHELNHGLSSHTSVLTEDNLAAYHDALAEAANYAAANGKFNRQVSFKSSGSESSQPHNVQTSVTHRPARVQYDADSENMDDYDTFPFDDDGADDDLMIAEANAEALENDDDGFYGQEFGFYARAHTKDSSEFTNGGFFAARGSNGIKRSHSGKANFQEPSLTPITERSEWSTRNSVASLQFHGGLPNQQSLPSPGISQLLESLDSPSFEDEMSLSALMKLRRGAFGGSSTSINSLGERSMPGSSPLAHVSSYPFPIPDIGLSSKPSAGTSTSIMESEEEDETEFEQLTLTQNTPRKKVPGPPATPHGQMAHLAVTESPNASRRGHHRRNSSGADSVSYLRDKDGHWVLERRRTGDDGEQEVIEREYLVGARI